jgi:hypothetical protein
MIKTTLISLIALGGIGLPTIPVPVAMDANIAYLHLSVDEDGTAISLDAPSDFMIDIAFTGDRHIRIGV